MKDCDVCWVALNENTIHITQGSSFNISEHVQVSLKAEEREAAFITTAFNLPLWMHVKIAGVFLLHLKVLQGLLLTKKLGSKY